MPKKKNKKSRRHRPAGKKNTARELKLWIAAFFLTVFLVGSLALLQQARQFFSPDDPPATGIATEMSQGDAREKLESALSSLTNADLSKRTADGPTVTYHVAETALNDQDLNRLRLILAGKGGDWRIRHQSPDQVSVLAEGRWKFKLLFSSPSIPSASPPAPLPDDEAFAVIIMDDLGNDLAAARNLLELDLAITFAVLPETSFSKEVAELAHRRGREVILHIPMEPLSYPATDPGPLALLTDLPEEEILARLQSFWSQVPHAVGGNNHMGSRFTQNEAGMRIVLKELARKELFFVDSLTTGSSVGRAVAAEFTLPSAERDLFLDNVQDVDKIRHEIRRLIQLAAKSGRAIGICHPYRETLEALRLEQESFAEAGVRVVPVSRLVQK